METGRAVIITQGFQNHAIRTTKWHYIRYQDGTEELYDMKTDPNNFHNLASVSKMFPVKQELATWLPKHDAEGHPNFNGQQAQNEKWEKAHGGH